MEQSINAPVADALFANEAWSVVPDGLEHRRTGYFIERAVLGARRADGLWEWPLQLAPKRWYVAAPFQEAFGRALALFGIEADPRLATSFAQASAASSSVGEAWEGLRPLANVASVPVSRPSARRALGKRQGALPAATVVAPSRRLAEAGA